MRRIWCLAILMATAKIMSAQSTDEISALRFSQGTYGNDARSMGAAGAFGAVGADVSALGINPAGIGLFRGSDISFSPSFNVYNSTTGYLGNNNTGQAYNLNGGNWGVVFAHKVYRKGSPWRFVNLGINTSRMDVFDKQINFSGTNTNNSYTQAWVQAANRANNNAGAAPNSNGLGAYPFYSNAWLGYQAYVIDPVSTSDSTHYKSAVPNGNLLQTQQNTVTGKLTETNITLGANYNDKIYIGAALGICHINYTETKIYSEQDLNATNTGFNRFSLTDAVNTQGYGFNAKLGTVIRFTNMFRMGVSVQSPTLFKNLTDTYGDSINSIVSGTPHHFMADPGQYIYTLVTPMKATLSGALIFKDHGFIDLDYTYIPYNNTNYNFNQSAGATDAQYQNFVNNTISAKYTGASNLRLGGEYAYKDFRVRAGAAYYGTPYSSNYKPGGGYDQTEWLFSLGCGVRFNRTYLDLAYAYQMQNSVIQPYYLDNPQNTPALNVPSAYIKSNLTTVMLTIGTKF